MDRVSARPWGRTHFSQNFPEVEPAPCYLPCFQGGPGVITFCPIGAWEGHWLSPDCEDVDFGCHPLMGSHIQSQSPLLGLKETKRHASWSLELMFPYCSLLSVVLHTSRGYRLHRGIGTKTYINQWNKIENPEVNSYLCSVNPQQRRQDYIMKKRQSPQHVVLGKLDSWRCKSMKVEHSLIPHIEMWLKMA